MVTGLSMRVPALFKAILLGFIPRRVQGRMSTMPADFLIRPDATKQTAHYGKDVGDHLPLADVRAFTDAYGTTPITH